MREQQPDARISLAVLRKQAGVTQVKLAKLMGVGQPRVSAIERGDVDTLTVATVRTYVEALGGNVRIVAHLKATAYAIDRDRTARSARAGKSPGRAASS